MTGVKARDLILLQHERGYSASEIARTMKIPLDEVRAVIIHGDGRPKPGRKVEFIEPPLFE